MYCIGIFFFFSSYAIGFGSFISYLVFKAIMNSQTRGKGREEYERINREQIKKFGVTVEEREKNIKKLFERKDDVISSGARMNFRVGIAKIKGTLVRLFGLKSAQTCICNASKRKRAFETGIVANNSGKLTRKNINYYLLAFVYGNGKCAIDSWSYRNNYENFKDGPSLVKFYVDKCDASVESATNNLLLEAAGEGTMGPDPEWLSNDDIPNSIFHEESGGYRLQLGNLNGYNLSYGGEGSLITIAPPGAGKTQCFVIPNMLNWQGAAVVLDIKGEIYTATHNWREKNIGKVYKFSPLDPANSNSYNLGSFVREKIGFCLGRLSVSGGYDACSIWITR